jgi:hypothetical protein
MYNQLIEIDKDGNAFLQDDSIALMPKMWEVYKHKRMGSKMVKWIVAVYDYKSPFRRFPEDERKIQVSFSIYEKNTNSLANDELVVEAIEEYIKFQYDPLIDEYNSMLEKSYQMTKVYRDIMPTDKNLEDLNKLQVEMGKAAKSRDAHKQLILKDKETESKIQGTDSSDFSLFEQEERLGQ